MDFAFEGLAAIATGFNVVIKSAEIVAVVRLSNRWRLMVGPVPSGEVALPFLAIPPRVTEMSASRR